jgi:hypothetical protein
MKRRITSQQYFQTVNLTYYLQAFSLLLFSVVVLFIIMKSDQAPVADDKQWSVVVPFVLLMGLATSYFLFRMMVKKIDPAARMQDKFPKYASALIVRSALLELPGLLAAIVAYLTLRPYYLGGSFMIFLLFLFLRPTKHAIAEDLSLSPKERELIDKPDAIVSEINKS